MGKKNKKPNKNQNQENNREEAKNGTQSSEAQTWLGQTQVQTESSGTNPNGEPQKTAQERADEFRQQQLDVHKKLIEKFKKEEEVINQDPGIEEKQTQLAKREQDELKKLEKVLKRENEFENVAGPGATNAKVVYDKIMRTLQGSRNITKQYQSIKLESDSFEQKAQIADEECKSYLKKNGMLLTISESFLKQNYDLYLKHETMLDEENQKRKDLAEKFQTKMADLSGEINVNKEQRQADYDKNQEIRNKIQKAIDDYKVKEDAYKKKMEVYNSKISDFQNELNGELKEGELGQTIKKMEKEKAQYDTTINKLKRASDDIQTYVKKFDVIKEEIDTSNKKFEQYKLEIENKKTQIQLLETQIENVDLLTQHKNNTQIEIENQRKVLIQQKDTLKNLSTALKSQCEAL